VTLRFNRDDMSLAENIFYTMEAEFSHRSRIFEVRCMCRR